jgi:hypothetical protein
MEFTQSQSIKLTRLGCHWSLVICHLSFVINNIFNLDIRYDTQNKHYLIFLPQSPIPIFNSGEF